MAFERVPLQTWINQQLDLEKQTEDPYERSSYRAAVDQACWVRDRVKSLMAIGIEPYEARKNDVAFVIGEHVSTSVRLPVYELVRPGLRLILRNNFYDWKLSVLSEQLINCDFSGLFHTTPPVDPDYTGNSLHPVYFEGFPPELVFGYYEPALEAAKRVWEPELQWSAEIPSREMLWTVVFLLLRDLGVVQPWQWRRRPE